MDKINWKDIGIGAGLGILVSGVALGILYEIGMSDINRMIYYTTKNYIYLKVSSVYTPVNNPVNITATAIKGGIPVNGVPITFYVNGKNSGSDITDVDGEADMIFNATETGTYNIYATSGNLLSNVVTVVVH